MANMFCVNKSGSSVPIYSNSSGTTQIGTLYNREAFGYDRNWGGDDYFCKIRFRNSSGSLSDGFLINPPANTLTGCTDYPYSTITLYGSSYKTFYMRTGQTIYKVDGSIWGSVASGKLVACKTSLAGDSHTEWKGINYVQNSSNIFVPVSYGNYNYGFVNTGLASGSGYNSIPLYGNW